MKRKCKFVSAMVLCAAVSSITIDSANAQDWSTLTGAPTVAGDLTVTEALTVDGTGNSYSGGTLTANNDMTLNENSALENATDGIINIAGALTNSGALTNQGEFSVTGTFTNNNTITGAGTLKINGGSSTGNNATISQAIIDISSGTFDNSADMTVSSQLNVSNGATLNNSANINATGATLTNNGIISNIADKTITADIFNNNTGATLTNNGSTTVVNLTNSGSITGTGTLAVSGDSSSSNTISQATINITGGTFDNSADMTAGTFTNNATVSGTGTLTVNTQGTSNGAITQGSIFLNGTKFDNNDTLTATDALNNNTILNNNKDIFVHNTTVKNATLTNTGTINNIPGTTISADKLVNTGTINLTKSKIRVFYQSEDINGVINIKGTNTADASDLTVTGNAPNIASTINIGNINDASILSTLNLKSGVITESATVNLAQGNVLNIDDEQATGQSSFVTINTNDTYAGDIKLANGGVKFKNLSLTTGKTSTTEGTTTPYYEQTNGVLALANSNLSMEDSSKISNGTISIDSNSQFISKANGFNADSVQSAGLIQVINDKYENYAISSNLIVGVDNTSPNLTDMISDTKAEFTTDLYARSNENKKYDSFGSDTAKISSLSANKSGEISVSDWKIHGDLLGYDAPIDKNISMNLFKGSVQDGHNITFAATDKEVFTPIGWYKLNSVGGGAYSFDLARYNPAVFRGQVTKVAQYQNQLAINDMLFNHTMLNQGFKDNDKIGNFAPNKYASANDLFAPYEYSKKDGGLWVKSYGVFERLNMNHGLSVGNNAYGTLIGADFGLMELKNGWSFMPTAYVGYNGAHQHWNGNGAYQNGGQAGFLGTWYKDNFMLGALAYGGLYGNSMKTLRGDDNTFNYYGGAATKAAYNAKLHKDWALQPNLLFSYNYFGQENWHTDFGQMGMMSGMLHGVNIAPGVNLIWEKETFSTYLTLQYMYNINQAAGGRAGNVNLPHVHMDRGYIQYGLGINKKLSDTFSGYGQVVVRNAGRTGVGFQVGLNWKLGK